MYILEAYNTCDREKIVEFIENNSFADLVTFHEGCLCSNKVPLFYDRATNELYGHFGNNNSQLVDIENSEEVLVIFSGANTYISPQWYVSENMVPTWNFQTIQVRGKASIVDDKLLIDILTKLTEFHESKFAEPSLSRQWSMNQIEPEKRKKMLNMITGFKIEITDIKFKEKMSQIRNTADQKSIINALYEQGNESAKEVADIMYKNIEAQNAG